MLSTRYFIEIAFDGTRYHGWQIQKNALTVQQVLKNACTLLLREPVELTGCGRTDAGVHASQFFAHFDSGRELSDGEREMLVYKLNSFLDRDIAILALFPVKPRVHARFTATARTYQYMISRVKNPFTVNHSHYLYGDLDMELMNRGADFLMQVTDFTSFSKVNTDTRTNDCLLSHARWEGSEKELIFTIRADRFLRNMVRAIVGTLLELGAGRLTFDDLRKIVAAKDRSGAGESVPACGLFLREVAYPEGIRQH